MIRREQAFSSACEQDSEGSAPAALWAEQIPPSLLAAEESAARNATLGMTVPMQLCLFQLMFVREH